jgi:hypothetical protein
MDRAAPTSRDLRYAEELVEYLSPTLPEWRQSADFRKGGTEWFFRGQRDARWGLVASGYRAESWPGVWANQTNWARRELVALKQFVRAADQAGVRVPGDSARVRQLVQLGSSVGYGGTFWPDDELLPLLAFGRHHSLPTRLLDWTRNRYIACFFASELQRAPVTSRPDRFAVFALQGASGSVAVPSKLLIRDVGFGGNINMTAQDGLFTYVGVDNVDYPHHDEADAENTASNILRLTLPTDEAPRLRQLLRHMGISASAVYPSVDGVVAAALDSYVLDEVPQDYHVRTLGPIPGTETHGRLMGKIEALYLLLQRRGITLNGDNEARVQNCSSVDLVDSWLTKTLHAQSEDEVFDTTPTSPAT